MHIKAQQNNTLVVTATILVYGIIPVVVLFLLFFSYIFFSSTKASVQMTDSPNNSTPITVMRQEFQGIISATNNEDMAGLAQIPAGTTAQGVLFEGAFTRTPSIELSPNGEPDIDRYFIENVTPHGFIIVIDPPQTTATTFKWRALDRERNSVTVVDSLKDPEKVAVHGE